MIRQVFRTGCRCAADRPFDRPPNAPASPTSTILGAKTRLIPKFFSTLLLDPPISQTGTDPSPDTAGVDLTEIATLSGEFGLNAHRPVVFGDPVVGLFALKGLIAASRSSHFADQGCWIWIASNNKRLSARHPSV